MSHVSINLCAKDFDTMQAANFYTVDVEKHSMGIGLRCWPTNQDYNNGKDCSASIATYAHEAPGAANDREVHCSADSLHKGGTAAAATAAAASKSPQEEAPCAAAPQVQCGSPTFRGSGCLHRLRP